MLPVVKYYLVFYKEVVLNTFIELIPLLAFFVTYYISKDIYSATFACIIANVVQIIISKILYKKISRNNWISFILVVIFGGFTLILHNKTFIMLKPTLLYWIFGFSLLIANKMNKHPIKAMFQDHVSLDNRLWQSINHLWTGFFIVMGILNLVIAYYCTEYVWVKFKVFGGLGLMFVCSVITGIIITRHGKALNK